MRTIAGIGFIALAGIAMTGCSSDEPDIQTNTVNAETVDDSTSATLLHSDGEGEDLVTLWDTDGDNEPDMGIMGLADCPDHYLDSHGTLKLEAYGEVKAQDFRPISQCMTHSEAAEYFG